MIFIFSKFLIPLLEDGVKLLNNRQGPNEYLYKFEGNLAFEPDKNKINDESYKGGPIQVPLDANQMLLPI